MKVFAGVLLLAFVACSAEQPGNNEEAQTKRGLEHSNNFALLNNLNIENKPTGGINPGTATEGSSINVGNLNTPTGANIQVTYNTENIRVPLGNPSPLPAGFALGYAPAYAPSYSHPTLSFTGINSIAPNLPLSYGNLAHAAPATPQINNGVQDSRNIIQTYIPQEVAVPQPYPVQLIKEVPQPYPVHITRTVQVPVHIRVPVEVPKPYEVRVPHPVPVPVHIRIPVPVAKPYAVQVTKTVAVPVEKPVYIKVPHPIQVPVPQPYPVPVPQPVQIRVPYPVILRGPEGSGTIIPSELTHLTGDKNPTEINPGGVNAISDISGLPNPTSATLLITPPPPTLPSLPPASTTGSCATCEKDSIKPQVVVNPSLAPITGNGLLPPLPPGPNSNQNQLSGLLNSYVASKEGGVYRREANKYQTSEYQKTW